MLQTHQKVVVSVFDDSQREPDAMRVSWVSKAWNDGYLTDVLCLTGSVGASMGLFILLTWLNGTSLPHLPWHVSLNTVISFVAIGSRALMLIPVCDCIGQLKWAWYSSREAPLMDMQRFDAASRSPLGGLRLLPVLRGDMLTTLGVFVTVAALAIEPFAQQTISYPTRRVASSGASVARAHFYHSGGDTALLNDARDMLMKGAILNGVFSPGLANTSITASLSCSTGNCTFPTYSTLAVCSQCVNTTSLMTTTQGLSQCCTSSSASANCDCNLPNGLSLQRGGHDMNISVSSLNTLDFDHISPRLSNFSAIFGNGDTGSPLLSADCVLYFCVQTLSTAVIKGVLQEEILQVYTPNFIEPSGGFYNWTVPSSMIGPNETNDFEITDSKGFWIGTWLKQYFNANTISDIVSATYYTTITTNNGNLSTTMAGLASSMTTEIRIRGFTANGTAWHTESYVHVNWPWLVFPFGLQLFAFAFLTGTVYLSTRANLPVWKSSILPLLFNQNAERHELEIPSGERLLPSSEEIRRDGQVVVHRRSNRIVEMEKLAKETKASLQRQSEDGMLLLS